MSNGYICEHAYETGFGKSSYIQDNDADSLQPEAPLKQHEKCNELQNDLENR